MANEALYIAQRTIAGVERKGKISSNQQGIRIEDKISKHSMLDNPKDLNRDKPGKKHKAHQRKKQVIYSNPESENDAYGSDSGRSEGTEKSTITKESDSDTKKQLQA